MRAMDVRKNYWSRIVLCASLFGMPLLTGCDSETGADIPNADLEYYSFKENGASSKASVVETDDAVSFRWDKSDQVTMWVGPDESNVSPYVFRTELGGVGSAEFEAYLPRETESLYYYGFYPAVDNVEDTVTVSVPVDGTICQSTPDNSLHLASYRAMFAPPVTRDSSSTVLEGVNFKHLTSLFVFDITNAYTKSIEVSQVRVKASQPIFYDRATYAPGSGNEEMNVSSSSPVEEVILTLGNDDSGLLVSENEGTLRAFLPLIPTANLTDVSLTVAVLVDDSLLESLALSSDEIMSVGVDRFLPGHYYQFYLDIDGTNVTWDMNKSIEAWELGGIIDVPIK